MSLWCHEVCGVGVREGAVLLVPLSAVFQSLLRLPTIKLGLSGVDSRVDGFVYVLGLCVSLQRTLLWGWEFLPLWPQPPQVFSVRDFWGFISPALEPWVVQSVLLPSCSSGFICMQMWDHPVCKPLPRPIHQPPPCLESSPQSCLCSPFLLVWVNVSLTPLWSDFHAVCFCESSRVFLFLNCCCPSFGCVRRQCLPTPPSCPEVPKSKNSVVGVH